MKKYLVGLIAVLALVVVPNFVLATSGDIDPQGDSSCVSINNNLRYRANDANTNGEVSVLQDFLQTNGYLQSNPVGFFGLMTTAAVKSFQSANGISSTGYVGPITREKIKTQTCSGQVGSTNTGGSTVSGCVPGAFFSATTGQSCIAVQLPTTPGCAVGAVFSSTTGGLCTNILNGISSTPTIVTPPTTIISSPTTVSVGGSTTPGCSVGMVFSATTGAPCTTTSNYSPTITTTLQLGSSGAGVVTLQQILVAKGFLVMPAGVAMGYFDQLTKDALISFQKASNITPADGVVGPMTRAVINSQPMTTTGGSSAQSGQPTITITSPNNNGMIGSNSISLVPGQTFQIAWTLSGLTLQQSSGAGVQIQLLDQNQNVVNGSAGIISLVTNSSNAGGYYNWTVPGGLPNSKYYVKLATVGGTQPYNVSAISNMPVLYSSTITVPPTATPATTTPPVSVPTTSTACPQSLTINGTTYTISPCNINLTMTDGQGDKNFSTTITATGASTLFGYSTRGYGVGFPTYGILGGGSGGASGSMVLNLHFSDANLSANGNQPRTYTGYLPIHIFQGSETGNDNNYLNLNTAVTVNPSGN